MKLFVRKYCVKKKLLPTLGLPSQNYVSTEYKNEKYLQTRSCVDRASLKYEEKGKSLTGQCENARSYWAIGISFEFFLGLLLSEL